MNFTYFKYINMKSIYLQVLEFFDYGIFKNF
jgi:hypothetical protein